MTTVTAPGDKSHMIVTTSHPGIWSRTIDVYVPAQYVRGTEAPFIVVGDGGSNAYKDLATTLDNLIAQRRVPPMIAIQIGNGGQDAQGSQRGREYDAVSGAYAQFVEREVLPLVEKNADVKLTKNPDGRATMGLSSSGVAAFTMAWFYPDLYHRVLAFSPTMVNQQWPHDPSLRGGAWEYHSAWTGPATPNLISKAGVLTPAEPPGVPLIVARTDQADPLLVLRRRPGPVLSEPHHSRRHARLDPVERADGQGAGGEGLPLPVPVRAQRQARRPSHDRADAAVGAGVGLEGLSDPLSAQVGLAPDRHAGGRAHGVLEARRVLVVENLPRQHGGLAGRVEDRLAARGGEPVGLVGCGRIGGGRCRGAWRGRLLDAAKAPCETQRAAITTSRNDFAGMRSPIFRTSA